MRRYYCIVLHLLLIGAVGGCSWLMQENCEVSIFSDNTTVGGANCDDGETLVALYAYAEHLRGLDQPARRKEHLSLREALSDCQDNQTCLKLAWVLSSVEFNSADYDRVIALLDRMLADLPEPLLEGYINELRSNLIRNRQQSEQLDVMRYKMLTERRENRLLRKKIEELNTAIKNLEMKIEALTSIEQNLKNREQRQ